MCRRADEGLDPLQFCKEVKDSRVAYLVAFQKVIEILEEDPMDECEAIKPHELQNAEPREISHLRASAREIAHYFEPEGEAPARKQ